MSGVGQIDGAIAFNVVDTFSRKWISYTFDVTASKDAAIDGTVNAIASAKPDCIKLIIRTDNGSQYVSKKFREAVMLLGARQEFIWHHTHNKMDMLNHFIRHSKKNTCGHMSLKTFNQHN